MASKALIGALHVALGLDSAQFEFGLKKAQGSLGRFSKLTGISFAAVAAGGIAVASAMGVVVLRTANAADALSKASQKAGVATEALSRLKYAADFSDVSLEQLTGGLGKLGKAMVDAATNKGSPASVAFRALGVSVTDAAGKMRDTDAVFVDVAEALSRVEDGAVKTTLAQRLFGKSGADLLPLLNEGAAGLKRFADESDRTGNTLSTKTGKAAEKFNDTMAAVGKRLDGVALIAMEASLPALQALADTLNSPQFAQGAADLAALIIGAMKDIIPFIQNAVNNLTSLRDLFVDLNNMSIKGLQNKVVDLKNDVTTRENRIADLKNRLATGDDLFGINRGAMEAQIAADIAAIQPLIDKIAEVQGVIAGREFVPTETKPADNTDNTDDTLDVDLDKLSTASAKALQSIDPFQARIAELSSVLTETVDPFAQMKLDLTDLQTMFDHGRIGAEQFGSAVQKTVAGATASFAGLAGEALGALSEIFEGNKELAVASAIVNGIGSIAKTLETYGVTPWGIAAASVAALTAAANVASILSTSSSSKSMPGTSTPSAAVSEPAASVSSQAVNITLNGQSYGRDQVRDLLDQIKDVMGDGYVFKVS